MRAQINSKLLNMVRRICQIRFFMLSTLAFLILPLNGQDLPQPALGESATDFELLTLEGRKVALKDLRGKLVVIHFAATW